MIFSLSKETISGFLEERSFFHGAALSYYAIFSIFPLIFLLISLFGRFLGKEFILEMIYDFLTQNVGLKNLNEIMEIVGSYNLDKGNIWTEISGILLVLIASSAFINSLKNSINEFYNIKKTIFKGKKAIRVNLLERIASLLFLAISASIFIVIYLFHSIGFTLIQSSLNSNNGIEAFIINLIDFCFSILLNYLMFLLIFKYLNNAKVPWRVASMGAIVTSILLFLGQLLIKYYLLNIFVLGTAGIAGSLFIFMAWVFYSSQIIFIGAKFTYIFSIRTGQNITSD